MVFSCFDDLSAKYGIEKIKTIGDSYFAVGGLDGNSKKGATSIVEMSREMIQSLDGINKQTSSMDINIRIGIHAGPVVTGVIGKNKFAYDLWGAAVNMASRMESTSKTGKIHISERVKSLIGEEYSFKKRKDVKIKGIGTINIYIIL